MELPVRKHTRIPNYNYASHNYYFVTVCTHHKKCIFGQPNSLNQYGIIAKRFLLDIERYYPQVIIDQCVVMPNHIHAIIIIGTDEKERQLPNLTRVIGQYKMAVSKEIHKEDPELTFWQRSFHDHIIRNQGSYEKIWMYIENNPQKWEEDCFYCK